MTKQDLLVPYIAVTGLSLLALLPFPYGYYTFLKIIVTFCAGATAHIEHRSERKNLTFWLCVAVTILFNPIIPIHLTREIWLVFNLAVASMFGYLAFRVAKKQ